MRQYYKIASAQGAGNKGTNIVIFQIFFNIFLGELGVIVPNKTHRHIPVPQIISEIESAKFIGDLCHELDNSDFEEVVIDFSKTYWSDPLPLLQICCVIAKYCEKTSIKVHIGTLENDKHRIFLKFMSTQGFIEALGCTSVGITLHDQVPKEYHGKESISNLIKLLNSYDHSAGNDSLVCVGAKIINPKSDCSDDFIIKQVEKLTEEINAVCTDRQIIANTFARERILQKVRRIILETMLNTYEHGYGDCGGPYGIYARIKRQHKLSEIANMHLRELLESSRTRIPTYDKFIQPSQLSWIEVYICDTGAGIASRLKNKRKENNNKSFTYNSIFKNNKTDQMFKRRDEVARGQISGLRLIDLLMSYDSDYSRLVSNNEWVGGVHFGEEKSLVKNGSEAWGRYKCMRSININPGTSFCFKLNIRKDDIQFPEGEWSRPDEKFVSAIKDELHFSSNSTQKSDWIFIDSIFDKNCRLHDKKKTRLASNKQNSNNIIALRPPRNFSKRHFAYWLELLLGAKDSPAELTQSVFVICDLSPFNAHIVSKIIEHHTFNKSKELTVYILSKTWDVTCYIKQKEGNKFYRSCGQTKEFYSFRNNTCLGREVLFELKKADSHLVFSKLNKLQHICGNINWKNKKTISSVVSEYISVEDILSDSRKRYVCYRSLQRYIFLFGRPKIYCCDPLLKQVFIELKSRRFKEADANSVNVILSSVTLSARTIRLFANEHNIPEYVSISLFIHPESNRMSLEREFEIDTTHFIGAFNWTKRPYKSTTIYNRIGSTPYISQEANRYTNECSGVHCKSKSEMFKEMEALDCLRIGHYTNNTRHELVTLNTALAFSRSAYEHSALVEWIYKQLKTLSEDVRFNFSIIVYPQHYAADIIVRSLKNYDTDFDVDVLFKFIPVNFFPESRSSVLELTPSSKFQIIKVFSSLMKFKQTNIDAIIIDDDVVEGRYILDLTKFIKSIGVKHVATVCLVDRTSTYHHTPNIKSEASTNKRYWLLDVPLLGNENHCILCEAVQNILQFARLCNSPTASERIYAWAEIWRHRDLFSEWDNPKIENFTANKDLSKIIGILTNTKLEYCFSKSYFLTTICMEISRVNHRHDVALKLAILLAKSAPNFGIEIIAVQFLLYFDALSFGEKYKRIVMLIQFANALNDNSKHTPLVGICISLCSTSLSRFIWDNFVNRYILKNQILNFDLSISLSMLLSSALGNDIKPQIIPPQTALARANFVMIGFHFNTKDYIVALFRYIGIVESARHDTMLHSLLYKTVWSDNTQFKLNIKRLGNQLSCVRHALVEISKGIISLDDVIENMINSDIKILSAYIKRCLSSKVTYENSKQLIDKIANRFYVYEKHCISKRYRDAFFLHIENGTQISHVIQQLIRTSDSWLVDYFQDSDNDSECNFINCINDLGIIAQETYVYFDYFVQQFIINTLKNAKHAKVRLPHPVKSHVTSRIWWTCKIDHAKDYIKFYFFNAAKSKDFVLKFGPEARHIERIGGIIKYYTHSSETHNSIVFLLTLVLPLHSSFMRPGDTQ